MNLYLFEIVYIKRGDDYKNIDSLIKSVSDDNYKNAFKICKFAIQLSVFIREDLVYHIENELSTDYVEVIRILICVISHCCYRI